MLCIALRACMPDLTPPPLYIHTDPTFTRWTRRPTPTPDPNAPTRKPRRTWAPSPAPEAFLPPEVGGGTTITTGGGSSSSSSGTTSTGGVADSPTAVLAPGMTPPPTPLPPPPPPGHSVDGAGAVGDVTKAFDWTPVIYASVATGILAVVLITIAIVIRLLRVRAPPLSPSIAPSDLDFSASLRSASASGYSGYSEHRGMAEEEMGPSPSHYSPRSVDASGTAAELR